MPDNFPGSDIFVNLPVPVIVHSINGEIKSVNNAAKTLLSFDENELIGENLFQFFSIPKPLRERFSKLKTGEERSLRFSAKKDEKEIEANSIFSKDCIFTFLEDVTEKLWLKSQAEKMAFSESDLNFSKKLLETAHAIILLLDKDGKIELFNKEAERITGYKSEEVTGKNWIELFIPEGLKANIEAVRNDVLSKDESKSSYINPILTKNGKERIIQWKNTIIRKGKDLHVLSIGIDITERERLFNKLSLEKERLFSVLDALEERVTVIDPETHKILYANPALKRQFGDVEGKLCFEALQSKKSPCKFCTDPIILSKENLGEPYIWEHYNKKTDRWYRCTDKAIKWIDGRWVRFEMAQDITESKRLKDRIKKIESLYRTLFETIPDPILVIDSKGKMTSINSAAEKTFGYSKKELLGENLFSEQFFPTGEAVDLRLKLELEADQILEDFRHKNGSLLKVEILSTKKRESENLVLAIKDVTQQELLLESIKESEHRLSQIIEGTAMPIFVIDKEHRITHWNRACEELTGIPAEEKIGTKNNWFPWYSEKRPVMADLIVENSIDEIKKWYSEKNLKSSSFKEGSYEAEGFFSTISERWLHFTASPIKDSEGEIVGAIETIQDITELKELENRFRGIFENAPNPMLVFDFDFRIIAQNPALNSLIGFSKEELEGKKLEELKIIDEETLLKLKNSMDRVSKGESVRKEMLKFHKKDGSPFIGELWLSFFQITSKLIGFIAFIHDVTERENAKKKNEEARKNLKELINGLNDSIFELDLTGKFTLVNPAFEKLLGLKKGQLIGKSFEELNVIAKDEIENVVDEFSQFLKGNFTEKLFSLNIVRDGKKIPIELNASRIKKDGELKGIRVVGRDISLRKEVESAKKRFKLLFDSSKEAIFVLLYPSFEIIDANPAASKLLNLEGDISGKNFFEFFPDSIEKLKIDMASGIFRRHKFRLESSDSVVEMIGSRFNMDGSTYIQLIARDVTELDRNEKELERRINELEKFHEIAIGREERILELEKKIGELKKR